VSKQDGQWAVDLTPKEAAVARRIVEGKANKEIAQELGCSTKTIEFHASNLFRKLGVNSRLELACKLLREHQDSSVA
jgi:DNA-binding NarL/FixJ family response regulator